MVRSARGVLGLVVAVAIGSGGSAWAAQYDILDLGGLGGQAVNGSQGRAINASGQVTGMAYPAAGANHAFLASPHAPIDPVAGDLGLFGGFQSIGYGINASGQVVGYAVDSSSAGAQHAFRSATASLPGWPIWAIWAGPSRPLMRSTMADRPSGIPGWR